MKKGSPRIVSRAGNLRMAVWTLAGIGLGLDALSACAEEKPESAAPGQSLSTAIREKEQPMPASPAVQAPAKAGLPPLDAAAPAKTETATFALG